MTRILVVEDEPSISAPLAYLLQREGSEVTVVDDGLEAVAEFDRNGADLVLLDLTLPGHPGADVILHDGHQLLSWVDEVLVGDTVFVVCVRVYAALAAFASVPHSSREHL